MDDAFRNKFWGRKFDWQSETVSGHSLPAPPWRQADPPELTATTANNELFLWVAILSSVNPPEVEAVKDRIAAVRKISTDIPETASRELRRILLDEKEHPLPKLVALLVLGRWDEYKLKETIQIWPEFASFASSMCVVLAMSPTIAEDSTRCWRASGSPPCGSNS